MADGDVQAVGVVVADVLPVHGPRPQRHPPLRNQLLEAVGLQLGGVGPHHLGDAGQAGFQPHEDEAEEDLQLQRRQAVAIEVEVLESLPARRRLQGAVQPVAPGVVGADHAMAAVAAASV